jgi:hypothetical protein
MLISCGMLRDRFRAASAAVQPIVKIVAEISTIGEHFAPEVDAHA